MASSWAAAKASFLPPLHRSQLGAGLFDGALDSMAVESGAAQLFEGVVEGFGFYGFEA
jgi:hypothetical protein